MKYLLVGFKQETIVYKFGPNDIFFVVVKDSPWLEVSLNILSKWERTFCIMYIVYFVFGFI